MGRILSFFGVQKTSQSIAFRAVSVPPVNGWYLPYPPADGIAVVPTEAPVNQVPYEHDFLNHCLHVRSRAADRLPPARATSTPH